jgi:hypothetical protein
MKGRPAMPFRVFWTLAAAVLAVHLLLLRAAPGPVHLSDASRSHSFITRSIAAELSAAVAAVPAPSPAPAPAPAAPQLAQAHPAKATARPKAAAQDAAAVPASLSDAPHRPSQLATTAPAEAAPVPAAAPAPRPAREMGAQAVAFAIPGSVRLHYKVSAHVHGFPLSANAELQWRQDGNSYEAVLQVGGGLLPALARTQRSTGQITPEGLAPLRFSDKTRSEEAAHFEREKGKLTFSNNHPDVPLQPGAQDRLSILLQLGAMIGGEPKKYPPGTIITIQTASTRDAEPWLFTVEGDEELRLPGGTVTGLKLIRNPRREFDQTVELWLAPRMDYVPVRLRLTQPNGDSLDQQWSSTDRG